MLRGMQSTRWWDYITEIIGDSTYSQAATKAGFDKSAFTRWKKGARADPDFVVKIARAYDANVLEALVAAEFITEAEAKLREVKVGGIALSDASNRQLLDEINRRSDPEARHLFTATADSDVVDLDEDAAVFELHTPATPPDVEGASDDEILRDANALRGAAHRRMKEHMEPELP